MTRSALNRIRLLAFMPNRLAILPNAAPQDRSPKGDEGAASTSTRLRWLLHKYEQGVLNDRCLRCGGTLMSHYT